MMALKKVNAFSSLDSRESRVAAAKVNERLAIGHINRFDFAHDYRVIAARILMHDAALDVRERAVNQRRAGRAFLVASPSEPIFIS